MGKPRKLSELQGEDPLILTLSRGHYCPKEHQQHLELAAFYPKIAVAYTQVVTIATDDHHTLQEFRASVGAQWVFLSDPERTVQKDLLIQEYTDPEHNPMIPHTLVLKPGLVIHSIYNGYWFWGRPSIADLWRDLRTVTSEIRPDWDLSRPGMRGSSRVSTDGTSGADRNSATCRHASSPSMSDCRANIPGAAGSYERVSGKSRWPGGEWCGGWMSTATDKRTSKVTVASSARCWSISSSPTAIGNRNFTARSSPLASSGKISR
jgi:peroxiredoxin